MQVEHRIPPNTANETQKRALVVDDDPGVRHLLWTVLRREGWEVVLAGNVREAEHRMQSDTFSLLITDHAMPGEDGLSFVRRIRSNAVKSLTAHRNVPVIMVSSFNDPAQLQEVDSAGVGAFVEKPFRPQTFAKVVQRLEACHTQEFIHVGTYN
jgi:CheY-like chemotaxis protein